MAEEIATVNASLGDPAGAAPADARGSRGIGQQRRVVDARGRAAMRRRPGRSALIKVCRRRSDGVPAGASRGHQSFSGISQPISSPNGIVW